MISTNSNKDKFNLGNLFRLDNCNCEIHSYRIMQDIQGAAKWIAVLK